MDNFFGVLFTLGMVGFCLGVVVLGVWGIMELLVIPWVQSIFQEVNRLGDNELIYSHWSKKHVTKEQYEEEQKQIKEFHEWFKKETRQ